MYKRTILINECLETINTCLLYRHCTVYIHCVQCTVYRYSVQCTEYRYCLQCTVYRHCLQCTVYRYCVHCTVYWYCVQCTVYRYSVQCTVYRHCVQCTVYRHCVECTWYRNQRKKGKRKQKYRNIENLWKRGCMCMFNSFFKRCLEREKKCFGFLIKSRNNA